MEESPGKSSEERTSRQKKKDKTERVIGLGRRTTAETVKWNQMKALRFQTGGRHQTSLASFQGDIEDSEPIFPHDTLPMIVHHHTKFGKKKKKF